MKKRVRIKDIADRAGVSTGTVDRVLHNRGNVAPQVKKKVMEVVEEMGYVRNRLASALAYNKNIQIATLLPRPEEDPYWEQTDSGMRRAMKAVQHYGLLSERYYFEYFDSQSFVHAAEQALEKQPDGLLFPPLFAREARWLLGQCENRSIPAVIINTDIQASSPLCYIGQDSYQSGVLGARLLDFGLNSGQSCCIMNLDPVTEEAHHLLDKEQGFKDYFAEKPEKRIEIIRKDFDGFNDQKKVRSFLQQLLKDSPSLSGIFVTNSRAHKIAGCLHEITDRNIKIVGFDLIADNLNYLKENKINFLINQNPADQGFLGVNSLFRHLILKEEVEKVQYLPLDIVVKENAEYYLKRPLTLEMMA